MAILKNEIWRINIGLLYINYIKEILSWKHFPTSELLRTFWKLNFLEQIGSVESCLSSGKPLSNTMFSSATILIRFADWHHSNYSYFSSDRSWNQNRMKGETPLHTPRGGGWALHLIWWNEMHRWIITERYCSMVNLFIFSYQLIRFNLRPPNAPNPFDFSGAFFAIKIARKAFRSI